MWAWWLSMPKRDREAERRAGVGDDYVVHPPEGPSVEDVMRDAGCSRAVAEQLIAIAEGTGGRCTVHPGDRPRPEGRSTT